MVGALSMAFLLQTQKPTKYRDFENSQITVKFLREISAGYAVVHYGNDLNPYLISQDFTQAKPIPGENEPGESTPKSFTISKPEKDSWKFTAPADSTTLEVEADASVVIPYQRMDYAGFTVLDAKTGAKLWTRKPCGKGNRTVLALEGGVLYQWDAGHLTATSERTGEIIWDKPIEARADHMEFSPMVIKGGRLYLNLEIDKKAVMVCFDTKTGGEYWRKEIGYPIWIVDEHSLPGFAVVGNRIVGYQFAKTRDERDLQKQTVFCLDANSGLPIWDHPVAYTAWPFTPEANETSVFVGSLRRPSFIFNITDGTQVAKLDLRWGWVVGQYIVDLDEQEGLVVYNASSGERIGRIQLLQRTLWMFRNIRGRLILYRFGDDDTRTTVLYEIIPSK